MIRGQRWRPRHRLAKLGVGVTVAAAAIVPMARMAQVSAATEPCVVSYQVNQATSLAYNGSVATGGTVSLGFQGTFSGSNDAPADFAVNGVACNGGSPSPPPTPPPSVTTSGSPCNATVFCDSFEDQAGTLPSGRWSVSTPDCSGTGTASVDSTVAHAGGKSVRISGGASYCNHVFIADTADMAAGPDVFVRFWVMHNTPLPTGHVTFLAMTDAANGNTSLRLGGQNGALMWNRQFDDATLPDQSPAGVAQSVTLPVNTWECIEFEVNSGNGHITTWVNGTSVPGLTEDGVPTPDIDDQWLAQPNWRPRLTDLRLGWESYASETDTLWFDDVALSSARIGCLSVYIAVIFSPLLRPI